MDLDLHNEINSEKNIYYPKGIALYSQAKIPAQKWGLEGFYKYTNQKTLIQLIVSIVEVEGPIHIDILVKRLTEAWGIRAGRRVVSTIQYAIWSEVSEKRLVYEDSFLWLKKTKLQVRIPKGELGIRDIEQISQAEIQEAMKICLISAMSLEKKDLVREIANLYQLRVTTNVEWRIEKVISDLIKSKDVIIQNEKIFLNK